MNGDCYLNSVQRKFRSRDRDATHISLRTPPFLSRFGVYIHRIGLLRFSPWILISPRHIVNQCSYMYNILPGKMSTDCAKAGRALPLAS